MGKYQIKGCVYTAVATGLLYLAGNFPVSKPTFALLFFVAGAFCGSAANNFWKGL